MFAKVDNKFIRAPIIKTLFKFLSFSFKKVNVAII